MPSSPIPRKRPPASGRYLLWVFGFLFLTLLVNEFTFSWFTADKLVDLPGRHRRLIYFAPWILRSFNALFLVLAWYAFRGKASPFFLLKNGFNLNLLIFIFSILLLAFSNPVSAGRFMIFRLIFLLLLLFQLLRITHLAWVSGRVQPWLNARWGLPVIGLLTAFLLLEAVFFFIPRSHHTLSSYGSRIWYQRYWDENALGFRDRELSAADLQGKTVILCSGDSFTAGAGVKDPSDRYSDQLQERLGPDYRCLNLGVNGLGPEGELEILQEYPFEGDILLHSWFVNDIHQAAEANGMQLADFMDAEAGLRPSLHPRELFYSVNFFWWSFPHTGRDEGYLAFLQAAYSNSAILDAHLNRLHRLVDWAGTKKMKVVVLMFPWLRDVAGSDFAVEPVRSRLQQNGVPVLSLSPLFARHSGESLVVNAHDGHPNLYAHGLVADTLEQFLRLQGWIP
jgi:hypothetical protein